MQSVIMDRVDIALPSTAPHAELSHIVRLDEITATPATTAMDASADECAALAARFDLPSVRNVSVELTYRRARGGQMVRVDGRISAVYGQLCSVTDAPMVMSMEEEFQTEYTLSAWEKVSEFDLDQPEVLTDDFVDLGEIAAQYFGLAIDPYARRAAAETLAELTDSLTEVVRELASQVNGYTESVPAVGETIEFAEVPEDIETAPPMAKIISFPTPEMTVSAQSDLSGEAQSAQPESLFFKYLRRLRDR